MENLTELLNQLALKFNTTAEKLYEVLVYQAGVHAISVITVYIIVGTIFFFSLKVIRARLKKLDDDDFYPKDSFMFPLIIACIIAVVTGIWFIIGGINSIQTIIVCIFNPEYWALQQILPI